MKRSCCMSYDVWNYSTLNIQMPTCKCWTNDHFCRPSVSQPSHWQRIVEQLWSKWSCMACFTNAWRRSKHLQKPKPHLSSNMYDPSQTTSAENMYDPSQTTSASMIKHVWPKSNHVSIKPKVLHCVTVVPPMECNKIVKLHICYHNSFIEETLKWTNFNSCVKRTLLFTQICCNLCQ